MTDAQFVNSSFPPRLLDLEDGKNLPPGERAAIPASDYRKALEEEGALTRVREPSAATETSEEEKK
jgi:hypothetical protein